MARHLALTREKRINLEHVSALTEIKDNPTLRYTLKTLELLEQNMPSCVERDILEDALKWSETAKAGMPHERKKWAAKDFNLFAHNIGSAQIYRAEAQEFDDNRRYLISALIETHGLLGQTVRGETPLRHSSALCRLLSDRSLNEHTVTVFNACIIGAVSQELWENVRDEISGLISVLSAGCTDDTEGLRGRLKRLRRASIQNGEDYDSEYERIMSSELEDRIVHLIGDASLWYVEAALYDFSFEEFIKILLLLSLECDKPRHISFEPLMQGLYYDHNGKKRVNIYKKRIIEKFLAGVGIPIAEKPQYSPHLDYTVATEGDTVLFDFTFSPAGGTLIEFCVEAEKSGLLYEKAVVLLFDLFDLRKDAFDRFYNEESYLGEMNDSMKHKRALLDYITGDSVLDIGPGGGGLMDMILERYPEKRVTGIDFSQNVIDSLIKRKQRENRKWEVLYGDALHLNQTVKPGDVDTIIFCSVLHEFFSYIEFEGRKFNPSTIAAALRNAFDILAPGGRIIIRDGIMTEPEAQTRTIRFLSEDGMTFLERYAKDFMGRTIRYDVTGHNTVSMPVNDAMEFLYTYTWGEESYAHEVNEQFGIFTPSGYIRLIRDTLGTSANIVMEQHFLQDGYHAALAPKIELRDETGGRCALPDSTCIIVIQKNI